MGLSNEAFWSSTYRELAAHRAVMERSQDFWRNMEARILAALHNGPMTRKDGKLWGAEMFLPGYRPDVQPFEDQKAIFQKMRQRKPSAETTAAHAETTSIYQQRVRDAQAARAAGKSDAEVRAIMEGN
jgi:hypothetical protein